MKADTVSPATDQPATLHGTDFDAIAEVYDESLPAHVVEHYLQKRLAFIIDHATPGPVLDVGCGTGVLAERVTDAGFAVTGLDPSPRMLQILHRKRPEIPLVVGSGVDLPFPDNSFVLTYCVAVMHHVAEPAAVRLTLMEMARVTKPGGKVLIWDHNPHNPYWPYLMKRVPQDTGAERLIPEQEIIAGLRAGKARPIRREQLGMVPDFTPRPLLGAMQVAERAVEMTPGLRRLCAHNVIVAMKTTA